MRNGRFVRLHSRSYNSHGSTFLNLERPEKPDDSFLSVNSTRATHDLYLPI
jgi:hypothetical protein